MAVARLTRISAYLTQRPKFAYIWFTATLGPFRRRPRWARWAGSRAPKTGIGLSPEEWALRKLNGHPRLSIAERRQVVAALSAEGLSQREIAAVVGASVGTVNADIAVQNRTEDEEEPRYDADFSRSVFGVEQPDDPELDEWDEAFVAGAISAERHAARERNTPHQKTNFLATATIFKGRVRKFRTRRGRSPP